MINHEFIDFLAGMAIILPAFIFALSFHEFCHAAVAYLLGDDTAQKQGRLTLNPLAHLDLWGTIFLIIARVGWAKPVPFNIENFKYPRIYSILTALAGPVANFFLAFVSFFIMKYIFIFGFPLAVNTSFIQVFQAMAYVNVMLGTFNLLPIPPLDGSHFIFALLYKRFPKVLAFLYQYSLLILLLIFFLPVTRDLLLNLIFWVHDFIKSLVF